jgi:hypothetical protein
VRLDTKGNVMPAVLPLFVFVSLGLVAWLLVGLVRSRSSLQQEAAEGEAAPAPRKGMRPVIKVALFVFVVWLVLDLLSISVLGTNAQNTFQYVSPPPEQKPAP